jgi:hypothetical protein
MLFVRNKITPPANYSSSDKQAAVFARKRLHLDGCSVSEYTLV